MFTLVRESAHKFLTYGWHYAQLFRDVFIRGILCSRCCCCTSTSLNSFLLHITREQKWIRISYHPDCGALLCRILSVGFSALRIRNWRILPNGEEIVQWLSWSLEFFKFILARHNNLIFLVACIRQIHVVEVLLSIFSYGHWYMLSILITQWIGPIFYQYPPLHNCVIIPYSFYSSFLVWKTYFYVCETFYSCRPFIHRWR